MPADLHVAVVGASGGIGRALVSALLTRDDVACVQASSYRHPLTLDEECADDARLKSAVVDVRNEAAVHTWLSGMDRLDWLINAVGLLHTDTHQPEKSIRQFEPLHFEANLSSNTLPSLLLAKHAERLLKQSEAAVFATVSARVGSIEDNRLGGWISYRSSKAALNMALKCLAIEWQRSAKRLRVLALHPGTTDTALSAPFQAGVPEGKLFSPEKTAALLLVQIEQAHAHPSGRFIDYAGEPIAW
jgi:NAD(P)-dependent dehydrogenase (short-subunit alcohol dehydrogenase family)